MRARRSLRPELSDQMRQFAATCARVSPWDQLARPRSEVDRYRVRSVEPLLVTWSACAYTVEALEMQLRACAKPLAGALSIRQHSGLRSLVRTGALLPVDVQQQQAIWLTQVEVREQLADVFGVPAAEEDPTVDVHADRIGTGRGE